ncbi:MAG: hypothetical protein ACRENE_04750 [Polyangiaceae bacterium]
MGTRTSLLRFLGPAVCTCGLAVAHPCLAAPTTPTPRFEVTRLRGAEECPDAGDLEAAVSRALEIAPLAPPGLPGVRVARTRFDVQFSRGDAGYMAILRSKEFSAARTLSTQGDACEPLADAVAVAVAVLLGTVGSQPAADSPADRPARTQATQQPLAASSTADPPPDATPTDTDRRTDADDGSWDRKARNVAFVEFMGSGVGDSINYARFFEAGGVASLRFGFGYTQSTTAPGAGRQLTFPVLLELDSSETGSHNFHFGTGVTAVVRDGPVDVGVGNPENTGFGSDFGGNGVTALCNVVVGYRYLPREPGITVGVYGMGLFNFAWGTIWAGANAGVAF